MNRQVSKALIFMVGFVLITVLSCLLVTAGPAGAQPTKPKKITLKIVYEQPITDRGHSLFKIWQEKVNSTAPDLLHIQYIGAYEAIPTFQQMDALRRGTVDMAVLAPTFYAGILPSAMAIQCVGAVTTVPEARKKGVIALMDKIHRAKLGVAFLGGLWAGDRHVILLKKPAVKGYLNGLKIRAIPVQQPAVKALGGTVTQISTEETYTGLQTGLLDGSASPIVLVPDYKYAEVTNYIYYPFIPMASWVPLLVRAKVWDALPAQIQKIILDPLLNMEPEVDPFFAKMQRGIINNLLKRGLKKTGIGILDKAKAQATVKKIRKIQWKTFIEDRADPAWLPQLNAVCKPLLGID